MVILSLSPNSYLLYKILNMCTEERTSGINNNKKHKPKGPTPSQD